MLSIKIKHQFIFLVLHFYLVDKQLNAKRCNHTQQEVYYNQWCYRIQNLNNTLGCLNTTCLLKKLTTLYTSNPVIDKYEFTSSKSPTNDLAATYLWTRLVQQTFEQNSHQAVEHSILINQFRLNENVYIETQPINNEQPNLMIHDETSSSNQTATTQQPKCILGHQIHNNNESFNFKYGSCFKELPFICMKNLYRINTGLEADRCLRFREEYPGGNWIECDKVTAINVYGLKLSVSQKCCLFNFKLRQTFDLANSICAKFDSTVYSFKSKGYKEILENYAFYLNFNDAKSNESDFWTSCRFNKELNEVICETDLKSTSQSVQSTTERGLLISSFMHKKGKLKKGYFNLSSLIISNNVNSTLGKSQNYIYTQFP